MSKIPTARLVFNLKKKATRKNKALVQICVYHNRIRHYYSTGIYLYQGQWDDVSHVINTPFSIEYNDILNMQMRAVNGYIRDCGMSGKFSFDAIQGLLDVKSHRGVSFFDFIDDRVENRPDIKEGTRRHHRVLVTALMEHGKMEYATDVTKANILDFYDFIQRKGIRQTTIYNYMKNLKTYVNQAIDRGIISSDPFLGLKLDRGKNAIRVFLTEDEVARLMASEIKIPPVAKARDLFVFQCYTGLSYADMMAFDYENDIEVRDGRKIVTSKRIKSGEEFYIVLLKPAIAILEKYGYRLPRMTNQKYNDYLKLAVAHVGINKNVTSHSGRHTFAIMALNNGISMEVVARILGHSDIRTTRIYAKVLNKSVEDAFAKLEK